MNTDKAYATYQAATSPTSIRKALSAARHLGYGHLITAAGIRAGALAELRDALSQDA